jgi:hypothetical protein
MISLINRGKKDKEWMNLQLIYRLLPSKDHYVRHAKFDLGPNGAEEQALFARAKFYVLSFATIIPASARNYVSEADETEFLQVPSSLPRPSSAGARTCSPSTTTSSSTTSSPSSTKPSCKPSSPSSKWTI